MHHALEIQEILLNIFQVFGRCHDDDDGSADLASLARTCRAFKEPALDILWEVLDDLTPLARCLPEISYHACPTDPSWPTVISRVFIVLILNIIFSPASMPFADHSFRMSGIPSAIIHVASDLYPCAISMDSTGKPS